jgi:hypothetical protein
MLACGGATDQTIAQRPWERQVGAAIAVEMPEFAPLEVNGNRTEATALCVYAGPAKHLSEDVPTRDQVAAARDLLSHAHVPSRCCRLLVRRIGGQERDIGGLGRAYAVPPTPDAGRFLTFFVARPLCAHERSNSPAL